MFKFLTSLLHLYRWHFLWIFIYCKARVLASSRFT